MHAGMNKRAKDTQTEKHKQLRFTTPLSEAGPKRGHIRIASRQILNMRCHTKGMQEGEVISLAIKWL